VSAQPEGWVALALLGKTRGNRGEITAVTLSPRPERYADLREVYLFGSGQPYEVEETWFHQGTLIFKFKGIDTISDAERLYGFEVRVPAQERIPLEEGEFFQSDLIGCEVINRRNGQSMGRVANYQDGGGSGLLELSNGMLIPFARSICVEIDPAARRIAVELPEGLEDLNRP